MGRFFLVRHGEPRWSLAVERDLQGPLSDFVPLTELGVRQCEEAAKDPRLREARLVLSSPYTRALQSASIFCRELRLPLAVEYDLRERMPETGHRFHSVQRIVEFCRDYDRHDGRHPAGEPRPWEERASVRARVLAALGRYRPWGCVVVVTHEKVMESVLGCREIPCGSIHELSLAD
jgi:broad specificity phosphatase PhoE